MWWNQRESYHVTDDMIVAAVERIGREANRWEIARVAGASAELIRARLIRLANEGRLAVRRDHNKQGCPKLYRSALPLAAAVIQAPKARQGCGG